MATSIETQGHTVDEAIQIALNQLGVSREKVEIDILHHPRRGLLGIGARRAKVRATIRESVMLDGEEFDMSGGTALDDKPRRRRRRGGRNRTGRPDERPESGPEPAPHPAVSAPAGRDAGRNQEGDRRGGRRGDSEPQRSRNDDAGRQRDDRRGGRGRGDQRQDRAAQEPRGEALAPRAGGEAQQAPAEDSRDNGRNGPRDRSARGNRQSPRDGGDRRDRGRGPSRPRPEGEEVTPRPVQDGHPRSHSQDPGSSSDRASELISTPRQAAEDQPPLDAAALEDIRSRAEGLVRELLQRMGFAAEVTSSIDESAGEAVISVRSESEGLLIGRRGQTLDSLEHLVNRMALRGDAQGDGRVLLDIGDYRKRRRESLDELASRLRSRAVGERRTVQVSPMSPRDRKFFAQAFADDDTVEVRALGAGFYRRVVVAPAGVGAAAAAESVVDGEEEAVDVDSGFAGSSAEN